MTKKYRSDACTLRQIVARSGLPFDVKIPNEVTIAAIKEARAMRRGFRFKSKRELFGGLTSPKNRTDHLLLTSGK
jgi:antitoxin component of RelBE/YafQ-DinJ toxin-antitoxin module